MKEQAARMLKILHFNKGFDNPEKWVHYAISNHFEKVNAIKLNSCPDCGSETSILRGQFIYYSSLARLQECSRCGIIFSDIRIAPEIIQYHFEQSYKDEAYFLQKRSRIFRQITNLVALNIKHGGNVLDIGGAKGHLLSMLQKERPDLKYVLNDLSKDACDFAKKEYGFDTIEGGINELERVTNKFDYIILSDVIYYENEIKKLWDVLPNLMSDRGTLIIRIPNKIRIIIFWQFIKNLITNKEKLDKQDKIKFFNPEHLFIFSCMYLKRRLKNIGFNQVDIIPSELLRNSENKNHIPFYYYLSKLIGFISFARIIITPSLLVVAKKK